MIISLPGPDLIAFIRTLPINVRKGERLHTFLLLIYFFTRMFEYDSLDICFVGYSGEKKLVIPSHGGPVKVGNTCGRERMLLC